jgi:hypothetical protein
MTLSDLETIPLGWSDERLPLHSVVSLYYSDEETLRRSLTFLRVGLAEPGTFCIVLADASRHQAMLDQLQEGYDGDLKQRVEEGKLAAGGGSPTFEDLARGMASRMDRALAEGYRRIRVLGFVAWGQAGWPDASALRLCEAEVNRMAAGYPAVIVCTYNVPHLPGHLMLERGLGNDPKIIINAPLVVTDQPERKPE